MLRVWHTASLHVAKTIRKWTHCVKEFLGGFLPQQPASLQCSDDQLRMSSLKLAQLQKCWLMCIVPVQTKTKSLITSQFEWLANRVTVSQSGEILMLSYKQAKTSDVSDVHEQSNENTSHAAAGGGQSWRQHGGSVVSTAASQQTRSWVWIQVCLSNIKKVLGLIPSWCRTWSVGWKYWCSVQVFHLIPAFTLFLVWLWWTLFSRRNRTCVTVTMSEQDFSCSSVRPWGYSRSPSWFFKQEPHGCESPSGMHDVVNDDVIFNKIVHEVLANKTKPELFSWCHACNVKPLQPWGHRADRAIKCIRDTTGQLTHDTQSIQVSFRHFYTQLYTSENPIALDAQTLLEKLSLLSISEEDKEQLSSLHLRRRRSYG